MEALAVGNLQAKIVRVDVACRELGFCNSFKSGKISKTLPVKNKIRFGQSKRLAVRSVQAEAVRPEKSLCSSRKLKSRDGVRLYVGLPLDAVSDCGTVNHARAIAAGLKALKLLGVEGVELPVWWGIAEKEAVGKYDWAAYLALAEMVEKAGLKLHLSLCFHASKQPKTSLPEWVSKISESQPDIFFKDRSGQYYKECLSFAVDDLPVLGGMTPIEVYSEFCKNLKSTFSSIMGSTITGISVGLGPNGELRYPSHHRPMKGSKVPGVGEFQCYDKNMLNILKQQAEASGNPLWGLGGPHDTPSYDQSPQSNNFFKDHGGSWETPYGDFFLSWYSNQLISHGNRVLSVVSSAFKDTPVEIYGKLPLMHNWYNTRSRPSELTAGFYNTQNRDGYDAVAEMFSRNSVGMILPGMDLSDEYQPPDSLSSPESLLAQIRTACEKYGVKISGQNSSVTGVPGGLNQIKKNLSGQNMTNLFTYQRMGASFFSPEHFPAFTGFVRSLQQPELHSDDLSIEEEVESHSTIQMQEA